MKLDIINNKYRKVLAAAQRARQIQKGARPLVQVPGMKATRIAIEEVERGFFKYELLPEKKKLGKII